MMGVANVNGVISEMDKARVCNPQYCNIKFSILLHVKIIEKAVIPLLDRGFLYGDSYYEVVITQDKQLVFMQDHLDRGRLSALMMDMNMAQSDEFLIKGIKFNQITGIYSVENYNHFKLK